MDLRTSVYDCQVSLAKGADPGNLPGFFIVLLELQLGKRGIYRIILGHYEKIKENKNHVY